MTIDCPNLRIDRAYDDVGRLQTLTSFDAAVNGNVVNQVQWSYNDYGLVAQVWQAHDGLVNESTTPSITYSYEDGSSGGEARFVRLSKVTYPSGRQVFYNYADLGIGAALGQLENIADDASGTTQYEHLDYLGSGTIVTETHPAVIGGLTLSYDPNGDLSFSGWDRFGRVVDQKWTNAPGTTTLDEYQYTYDRNSNRLSKTNSLNSFLNETYAYDGLDRLIDTDRNGSAYQSWTLDTMGNWSGFNNQGTSETRTANAANEITNISGSSTVTPTYDAAGNMTSGPVPNDPTTPIHMTYDAWNRLVNVKADDPANPGQPGSTIASYEYNGRNYRIQKVIPGDPSSTTQDFYYNESWQPLETRLNGDTDPSEQYIWDPRYIDAPVVRFHDSNTDGTVDDTLYYTQDANFNTTALINAATGNVVERYSYDPYGAPTIYDSTASVIGSSGYDNAVLYAGYHFDSETGLNLARNRYFNARLGTWVSRDPIGYADGVNLYAYCGGNSTNNVDPFGQAGHHIIPEEVWGDLPESPGKEFFKKFTTGPLQDRHGWSKAHKNSNEAIKELFCEWKKGKNLRKLTKEQAFDFWTKVTKSTRPEIQSFLKVIATQLRPGGTAALDKAIKSTVGKLVKEEGEAILKRGGRAIAESIVRGSLNKLPFLTAAFILLDVKQNGYAYAARNAVIPVDAINEVLRTTSQSFRDYLDAEQREIRMKELRNHGLDPEGDDADLLDVLIDRGLNLGQ